MNPYTLLLDLLVRRVGEVLGGWVPVFFWATFLSVWAVLIYSCWPEKEESKNGNNKGQSTNNP